MGSSGHASSPLSQYPAGFLTNNIIIPDYRPKSISSYGNTFLKRCFVGKKTITEQ